MKRFSRYAVFSLLICLLAGSAEGPPEKKVLFVASKMSDVYHVPSCRSAKKIKDENLVEYTSRQEAVKGNKRACKVCKP